jgi:hypothetical protein
MKGGQVCKVESVGRVNLYNKVLILNEEKVDCHCFASLAMTF